MDAVEIAVEIRRFFQELYPRDDVSLEDTTDLLNAWFVDSLGVVQTITFLEGRFGIDVRRADINDANFYSIETLSAFVARRLEEK